MTWIGIFKIRHKRTLFLTAFVSAALAAAFHLAGCGGNAGVSENTGDNIRIEGTVSGTASPGVKGPARAIAKEGDSVFLFVDGNAETSSQIAGGRYFFYGNYKARKLTLRFGLTNNDVYIGIVDLAATGTITLPAMDEYAVFTKKVLDAQVAEGKTSLDKYLITNESFGLATLISRVTTRINEKFVSDPATYGASKEQLLQKINDYLIDNSAFASSKIDVFEAAPKTFAVAPTTVSLGRSESTRFTLSMTGFLNNAVYFKVEGVHGGSAGDGTIGDDGTYVAPNAVDVQRLLTIEAQSVEDPAVKATAAVILTPVTVILNNGMSPINVSTSGGFYSIPAAVTGHSNKNIKAWYVNNILGGNYIYGSISSAGTYTPPAARPAGTVTIKAVPEADDTKYGQCEVVIGQ